MHQSIEYQTDHRNWINFAAAEFTVSRLIIFIQNDEQMRVVFDIYQNKEAMAWTLQIRYHSFTEYW